MCFSSVCVPWGLGACVANPNPNPNPKPNPNPNPNPKSSPHQDLNRTNKKDVKLLGCQTLPFCCCKFQHCWQVRLQLSPGSAARVEPRGLYTRRWPVTLASDAGRMLPAPLANLASGPSILPLSSFIADRDLPTSLAKVASAAGKSCQRRWQMPASPGSVTGQRRRPASLASVTCQR